MGRGTPESTASLGKFRIELVWRNRTFSFLMQSVALHSLFTPSLLILLILPISEAWAWTITAGFESGTGGAKAQGPDAFTVAGSTTTFSTERARSGSRSAKMVWRRGSAGFGEATGEFAFPQPVSVGQELWMRGYYYFAAPWSWDTRDLSQGGAVKIMRAHKRTSASTHPYWLQQHYSLCWLTHRELRGVHNREPVSESEHATYRDALPDGAVVRHRAVR